MGKLIDRCSIANIMAAAGIVAGIASVFLDIAANEMLVLITGAGIGYLFKNGIAKGLTLNPSTGAINTQ